ncbi:hypothetical protein P8C59_005273 [Phyllachora maydis]|uniref:Integrase catalytic domain-containing protein n=1 Tax=Phyllachora maydis TaxID=1825666 RepID=A0AAD9I3Z5_9PEZI|nr:hypothetical protein P8C59_005273 [Phyllachora maydis]
MADILEESRNPAIEAYRAAYVANSSNSTPNSNSHPSKKGKNKKKGKKKASYNVKGQNYSAKSAEQASFILGSYNLAIEEEEESDCSSNSSSSSDSNTQLAQLLALKGYKERKDFKGKGLKTSSNKAKYKDNQPRRRPRDPALYNSWLYDTGSTDYISNSKERFTTFTPNTGQLCPINTGNGPVSLAGIGSITLEVLSRKAPPIYTKLVLDNVLYLPTIDINIAPYQSPRETREPKPLTGTGDLPYVLREPVIEGNKVEKAISSPTLKEPNIVDRKSRYRWVFNLPNKSGPIVANAIKGFFRGLRNGFGRYPTKFDFDGGTEITDLLTTWLAKRGIKFSTSAPYIYEQNGLVERLVRVILDLELVNSTAITNKETTPFQALFDELEPADPGQSSRPPLPIRTLSEDKEEGEDYSEVIEVLKQHIKSHKRVIASQSSDIKTLLLSLNTLKASVKDSVSAIKNISSTLASLTNNSNAAAATTGKTSYSPRFDPFSGTIDLDSPPYPPRKEPHLGPAINSATKNLDISNTYSDSNQAILLMLLRDSLSSGPRAAISWIHIPSKAFKLLVRQYSRLIESKKEDVYNEFHALTFSTYRKGLSAFNAEFNSYLAKLTLAKIDIDPSLILNQYFKALESKFPSWVSRQKSSIRQARMLGLTASSLNIEYLMADILEESRKPAIEAYRAAHVANSSNSTPNSNSNPSKKGKNKKKGKKKASYNVEGQNYSAKSAEQASFMLGSYNLAIEEEEESDSSSNSSSSSDSNTQLVQLLALKGYKKHHISNSKERIEPQRNEIVVEIPSNSIRKEDYRPITEDAIVSEAKEPNKRYKLRNSPAKGTTLEGALYQSPCETREPKPLTGTRDLPYVLRELVIEGNKVEKAISSPTLKEPNIGQRDYYNLLNLAKLWHVRLGHIGLCLLKKTSSITKGLPNFAKIKEADFHCSSCDRGKVVRRVSKALIPDPPRVLDSIEGDTVKIRPRPYNRNPIVLLLVDRKSRYRWVFNLPNKSGPIVAKAIKGFFRGLRNGFGRYPIKFHFDGGTEITDLLTTWLAKRGIKFSTSAPYIHEQNGLVERSVRVILDRALFDELEPGILHIPNLERYRAIGAKGEAIIPLEKRSKLLKLTSRTEECKLLAVLGSKTYLVYIPSRRAVLKTSTVKFVEDNTVLSQPTDNTALEGELVDLDLDLEGAVSPDPSNLNTEKPISIEKGPSKLEPYESSSDSELDEPLPDKPINPVLVEYTRPTISIRKPELPEAFPQTIEPIFAPKPIEVIAPNQPITNEPLNNSDLILEGDKMQFDYYKLLAKTSSYILSFVYKARKRVISKDSTPTTYKQVLKLPRDERRVFKFLPRSLLPSNHKLITCRNVLKVKKDAKNRPIKYKSRLVARGFIQVEGLDYTVTYASTSIPLTWQILLAIGAVLDWEIEQADFIGAFLNSALREEIYMEIPEGLLDLAASNKAIYKLLLKYGYNPSTPNIIKLSKALYSLKQSPREWQDKLKILLKSLGYLPLISDPGVFYNAKTCHFIVTYVDDCLFIGPNIGYITDLKKRLNKVYAIGSA